MRFETLGLSFANVAIPIVAAQIIGLSVRTTASPTNCVATTMSACAKNGCFALKISNLKLMYRTLLFFSILCWATFLHSQNLTGEWAGTITQTGKSTSFNYALSLEQDGQKVFGTATSSNTDGSGSAKFEVGGTFDGKRLVLQELKQLEPENAKWCLKHIRLQYAENQDIAKLEGDWEAQGCKPGTMKLAVRQLAVGSRWLLLRRARKYLIGLISPWMLRWGRWTTMFTR